MKKIIHKSFKQKFPSKLLLGLFGGLLLMSCGAQMGGYSETDGVYYDPETDVLPEQVIIEDEMTNQVGEYYDYNKTSGNIIQNSNANLEERENRYSHWNSNNNSTDWGNYNGTEVYYDTWNYGWYDSYWNWRYGFGYSPWMWYGPRWYYPYSYYGGWYPYGFGYYDSFWGGYYNPYYYPYYGGGYYGYYGYAPRYYNYRRSGANGRNYSGTTLNNGYLNNNTNSQNRYRSQNSGFRGNNNSYRNSGFRNDSGSYRNPNNNSYRNSNGRRTVPTQNNNRYRNNTNNSSNNRSYRSTPSRSYNNSSSRGFSSPSSGTRSSETSSGSRSGRSGGFRR